MSETSILEQINEKIFYLKKDNLKAVKVSFSREGYFEFKKEIDLSCMVREAIEDNTVMGIPFEVDPEQKEKVVVVSNADVEKLYSPEKLWTDKKQSGRR